MSEPATLFELRVYRAQPDRVAALTDLLETVFLDAYEAAGARIEASFVDSTQADRWIWVRSFATARARGPVLERFYGSAVWKEHKAACSALMVRVEAAFLLRPDAAHPVSMGDLQRHPAPEWSLQINPLARLADGAAPGEPRGAVLVSDSAPNSYPRQPVRRTPVQVMLRPAQTSDCPSPDTAPLHHCLRRLLPTSRSRLGALTLETTP